MNLLLWIATLVRGGGAAPQPTVILRHVVADDLTPVITARNLLSDVALRDLT